MQIEVTIGVQKPGMVNKELVAASLPLGQVAVKVVKGGLDISDEERGDVSVIAMAGVAVRLYLETYLANV
jgi:Trm5-related predicted tRNA methylase